VRGSRFVGKNVSRHHLSHQRSSQGPQAYLALSSKKEGLHLKYSILLLVLFLSSCDSTPGAYEPNSIGPTRTEVAASLQPIEVPLQSDWVEQGEILATGSPGQWDVRMWGMITPCSVIKKDGTFFLYYIGADGNRADGGPAHRKLGVATSEDGVNFTKSGGPIISHQVGVAPNDESGVFSAGAFVESDGEVVLYYGAMEELSPGEVDGDVRCAVSQNGLDFTDLGDVFRASDEETNGTDELFAIGAFRDAGGSYNVYYWSQGGGFGRKVSLAKGNTRTSFQTHTLIQALASQPNITGGDRVQLSDTDWLVPIGVLPLPYKIQMRVTQDFVDLSSLARTYTFSNMGNVVFFFDRDTSTWYLYYGNDMSGGVRLKTYQLPVNTGAPE
jgi:hypothetical protein